MSNIIAGAVYGLLVSFITAFLFMLFGQIAAGGVTSFWGESWLYYALVIPFTITFAVLGRYLHLKIDITNKKIWGISIFCAFLINLYGGTIGAIFGEAIVRGGMETINIVGTLVWGTIYAFLLLPLSTLFIRMLVGLFYLFVHKTKNESKI